MYLGQHSVNETADLIAKKEIDMAAIYRRRQALAAAPDPTWDSSWQALQGRWGRAKEGFTTERAAVMAATALVPFVDDDMRTTETAYQGLLSALQNGPAGVTSPGGFQDLADRVATAQRAAGVVAPGQPALLDQDVAEAIQPTARDVDLDTIKSIDKTAKDWGMPDPSKGVPNPWDVLKDAMKHVPWWAWAGGAAVLFLPAFLPLLVSGIVGAEQAATRRLLPAPAPKASP